MREGEGQREQGSMHYVPRRVDSPFCVHPCKKKYLVGACLPACPILVWNAIFSAVIGKDPKTGLETLQSAQEIFTFFFLANLTCFLSFKHFGHAAWEAVIGENPRFTELTSLFII